MFCSVAAHRPGSSPPTPLPPSFHCFNGVTGACSSYCVVAHDWVARICQPWEQSSSRSWLPIVEAPACLRHPPNLHFSDVVVNHAFASRPVGLHPRVYLSDDEQFV